MKSYDPNIDYGIHIVEITLQMWEYVGHITQKIWGNCKGKEILNFDFECEDGNLESDCNLKYDEDNDYFSATLKDAEGNKMDFEGCARDLNSIIVKVEIVGFEKEKK